MTVIDGLGTHMKDRLMNEIKIMGNQDGIFEKPQMTQATGRARPFFWMKPVNGWNAPSYGATCSYSLSKTSFFRVSVVVEVRFNGTKRAVGAGADWSASGFGMLKK
jgi:hypothetical protein